MKREGRKEAAGQQPVNCFSDDGEGEREIIASQRPPFGRMNEERRKEAGCWATAGRLLAAGCWQPASSML